MCTVRATVYLLFSVECTAVCHCAITVLGPVPFLNGAIRSVEDRSTANNTNSIR